MKKLIISLLTAALLLSAVGCGGEDTTEYTLYYVNQTYTKPITFSYETGEKDVTKLLTEFITEMYNVKEDGGVSVFPVEVFIKGVSVVGDIATLDLSGSLDGKSSSQLLVLYAAVTKALTQIEDVSGVVININGESVKDSDGLPMGVMRNNRFVNNAVDDPDDYRESEVALYFGAEDGTHLIKTTTTVAYKSSTPIERVVIEKLINGPVVGELITDDGSTVIATLPSNLTLLGINIKDRICYVNIDDKIIKNAVVLSDEVAIFSIVNTLIELNTIDSVQITINGSGDVTMPMGIGFSKPFEYNNSIVQ